MGATVTSRSATGHSPGFAAISTSRGQSCSGAPDTETLFLSSTGGRLAPDVVSRAVTAYVRAGAPGRKGSCHLFRHSTATLMLDNGADVRYVGELLGHVKLKTTQLYTRVSIAKLRQVHAACHPGEGGQS